MTGHTLHYTRPSRSCFAVLCHKFLSRCALLLRSLALNVGAAGPALVGAAVAALEVPCTPALPALGCAAVGLTAPG